MKTFQCRKIALLRNGCVGVDACKQQQRYYFCRAQRETGAPLVRLQTLCSTPETQSVKQDKHRAKANGTNKRRPEPIGVVGERRMRFGNLVVRCALHARTPAPSAHCAPNNATNHLLVQLERNTKMVCPDRTCSNRRYFFQCSC